jgi:flagellar hook-basal body complex protein FliE
MPFSQDIENYLMQSISVPLQPSLITDKTEIIGILETVRNNILNWSLELEQKGILGEGMSFSNEEKKIAHQTNYQITNNIGSMHNSQLQQDSAGSTQSLNVAESAGDLKKFVQELKNAIDSLKLQQEHSQELQEAIATLEIQINSSKPKNVIINESLHTVRNILEGTAGSIVASGLIHQLGLFLT